VKPIDHDTRYKDNREKEALLYPSRVKDYSKVLKLNKTCDGAAFKKEAGREVDKFDEILGQYYTTRERGVQRPKMDAMGMSIKPEKNTMVWTHNNFAPALMETDTPLLLDRTHTPRGSMRATTLERNFSTKKWLYNKNTCDPFCPK